MSTPAPAAPQTTMASANHFELQDHHGKTKVTFYSCAPGPPVQGQAMGAELVYTGPEGNFTFRGTDLGCYESAAGKFLCVVLKRQLGSTKTLSLLMPSVLTEPGKPERFRTVCVRATEMTGVNEPGSHITYETEIMKGMADCRIMPMMETKKS